MLNFQSSCALPIQYDHVDNHIYFPKELDIELELRISLSDLVPILLNKSLLHPQKVYTEYNGLKHEEHRKLFGTKLRYDVISLPAGLLGIEYIKSHIYFTAKKSEDDDSASCVIEVLYGVVTVVVQKNEDPEQPFDSPIIEGLIIKVRKGQRLVIPKGRYYTFINTRNMMAIFTRIHTNGNTVDYSVFDKAQGLAYYVIRKNARQEIVLNPRYKYVPKIKKIRPLELSKLHKRLGKSPVYAQVTRNPQKFRDLLY